MLAVLRAAIAARRPHRPPATGEDRDVAIACPAGVQSLAATGYRWHSPQLARSA